MTGPLMAPLCLPELDSARTSSPIEQLHPLDPGLKPVNITETLCSTASGSATCSVATPCTTPSTPSSAVVEDHAGLQNINRYIPLGSLHYTQPMYINARHDSLTPDSTELLFASLPGEVKVIIGNEASRLLEAGWIRLFLHNASASPDAGSLVRVYLLPEDWGRRVIDRKSKSLKQTLRKLLEQVDVSPEAWYGESRGERRYFTPWSTAENVSLFYLFNNLPSPSPSADLVKNRYSRNAVLGLIEAASPSLEGCIEEPPIPGLKTRLYPYQARSAALMVQRESAPQLQLDPRLEVRRSPVGEEYFFSGRDGSFLREPRYYEANRGGILAETMGLGKTVICLAVILATKGHLPSIPPGYQKTPPVRKSVPSLVDMVAHTLGRNAIPAKAYLSQLEADNNINLENCKRAIERHMPYYEIPAEVPRLNRNTTIPPPRQLVLCTGTIIVVPRNLLHQWQSEIRKHVTKDGLKVLVMDTKPNRVIKSKADPSEHIMDCRTEIPAPNELMGYDIVLFTRDRFEQEIQDGADEKGRRFHAGVPLACDCPYIGATTLRDCNCLTDVYESPLTKLHWLRIIIDEGHNFSSGLSNAVIVAKRLQAERRWVVSGTPAKNLVGVELDLLAEEQADTNPTSLREVAMEQRKAFRLQDDDNTKAAKAVGSLASNFLLVKPWSESPTEGKLVWDDYIYRHEHHHRKTYSGFSKCFLRVLEGLVVKTRPEDVERDIQLPPMRHRTVYLKPCWYDKMTANLFIQVLRANAITSERTDVDYLFHKNSAQARHSLIRNLRQSNFTWTGFNTDDVAKTLDTSSKYLSKEDKQCTVDDANMLLESCRIVSEVVKCEGWVALSKAHEIGMAVVNWPQDSEEYFTLTSTKPSIIGATQLLEGQSHVDRQILLEDPADGLDMVGRAAKANLAALEEADKTIRNRQKKEYDTPGLPKAAVPSSCVGGQPLTSRRTSNLPSQVSPKKKNANTPRISPARPNRKPSSHHDDPTQFPSKMGTISLARTSTPGLNDAENPPVESDSLPSRLSAVGETASTPIARPNKRKITAEDEKAELPPNSPLRDTRIIGTTSAKLTYLVEKVLKHQASDKILIFYDGDNAAFYIAQCLEMLYINHRIYARTLDNTSRSQYVTLFNEDPSVRVLLIDVACGALGLNLNAASVVLIVNPINRPGVEAQAIKRAHRIGQTKEVLVETLVLEGTIEEAIFKRAKQMSRGEHLEAKKLEDDNQIIRIIQNAAVLPIAPGEEQGLNQFALFENPLQVFGRPGRDKYHRFGQAEEKSTEKPPRKRARRATGGSKKDKVKEVGVVEANMTPSEAGAAAPSSIFSSGAAG